MLADVLLRCAAVAIGGAVGSVARYGLSLWGASLGSRFPWGTFAANAIGSLAMGALMYVVIARADDREWLRLLVGVGLLGGLTTFSTLSYEGFAMFRQGHLSTAVAYILLSTAVGLTSAWAGWAAAGSLLPLPE